MVESAREENHVLCSYEIKPNVRNLARQEKLCKRYYKDVSDFQRKMLMKKTCYQCFHTHTHTYTHTHTNTYIYIYITSSSL